MSSRDRDFQTKLMATFREEACEHLGGLTAGFLTLEKSSGIGASGRAIETLVREAHSLKGAARAVGRTGIEEICQSLESVLVAMKARTVTPSPELFDILHRAADLLRVLVAEARDPREEEASGRPIEALLQGLRRVLKGGPAVKTANPAPLAPEIFHAPVETVRVPTERLDALLGSAEKLQSVKLAADMQVAELQELQRKLGKGGPGVESIGEALRGVLKSVERGQQAIAMTVDKLTEGVKQMLMQPFSVLLEVFPKLVRDLSRDEGKEASLAVHGAEIEIDKRILEELKDPLIHLVRNCIDHGIENPEVRRGKGKPPGGTITIAISQASGGTVEVLVEDDGAGIDMAKVAAAAAKIGFPPPDAEEGFGEERLLSLVFLSGLSTSEMVTEVSGRGLGLAIVKEKVEKLGGSISVRPCPGGGTAFKMKLPTTLAIFRGILVRAAGHLFAFPTASVERVFALKRADIKTVENRETCLTGGRLVPAVWLRGLLAISADTAADKVETAAAVVLIHAEERVAVLVDEVLDEQEMLVKHLSDHLRKASSYSGATVLGSGKVVPVLLVPELLKSATRAQKSPRPAVRPASEKTEEKKSVLVAEDSITSRILLKNILEGAGYEVGVAVDGMDAFSRLRGGGFDIVVSDVQMPRMNGFDLVMKIRADKKLADMPVILVTALESAEDKERGIEAGANAYIVKNSFDQGNLLEVLRRLL